MAAARVLLNAEELVRVNAHPRIFEDALTLAEAVQRVEHLTFQPLQVLQRDVEKVAGAAGGVEHAHAA